MYLFIHEDGAVQKSNTVTESDKQAVEDGILDIIAIGDYQPAQLFQNEWHEIDWVGEDMNGVGSGE